MATPPTAPRHRAEAALRDLDGALSSLAFRWVDGNVARASAQIDVYLRAVDDALRARTTGARDPAAFTVCETGFNAGHSAALFLSVDPRVRYVGFDIAQHAYGAPAAAHLAARFGAPRVHVEWADSRVGVAAYFARNPAVVCDVVSIDGDHSCDGVVGDFSQLRAHSARDAVFLFDDSEPSSCHFARLRVEARALQCHTRRGIADTPFGSAGVTRAPASVGFCIYHTNASWSAPPPLAAPVLAMTRCGSFLCPADGVARPFGVLTTAYSRDAKTFERLLGEAHALARSVGAAGGAGGATAAPPVALVTHAPARAQADAFAFAVPVRDDLFFAGALRGPEYAPQWLTRLFYYASSPFNVTLALDSNAYVCASAWPLLRAAQHWHVATANQLRDCPSSVAYWPHCFALTFARGAATSAFFEAWLLEQLAVGVAADDQQTLFAAVHRARRAWPSLRFGALGPNAALSLLTLDTVHYKRLLPAVTPVVRGDVLVVHMPNFGTCADWNAGAGTGADRVLVAVEGRGRVAVATSAAACDRLANESCDPRFRCHKGGRWSFRRSRARARAPPLITAIA